MKHGPRILLFFSDQLFRTQAIFIFAARYPQNGISIFWAIKILEPDCAYRLLIGSAADSNIDPLP